MKHGKWNLSKISWQLLSYTVNHWKHFVIKHPTLWTMYKLHSNIQNLKTISEQLPLHPQTKGKNLRLWMCSHRTFGENIWLLLNDLPLDIDFGNGFLWFTRVTLLNIWLCCHRIFHQRRGETLWWILWKWDEFILIIGLGFNSTCN